MSSIRRAPSIFSKSWNDFGKFDQSHSVRFRISPNRDQINIIIYINRIRSFFGFETCLSPLWVWQTMVFFPVKCFSILTGCTSFLSHSRPWNIFTLSIQAFFDWNYEVISRIDGEKEQDHNNWLCLFLRQFFTYFHNSKTAHYIFIILIRILKNSCILNGSDSILLMKWLLQAFEEAAIKASN